MTFSFSRAQLESFARLSRTAMAWARFVEREDAARDAASFAMLDAVPRYPVQYWPLFLGQEFRRSFATPARALFDAVRQSAKRELEATDMDTLRRYFGPAVREQVCFPYLDATDQAAHAAFRVDGFDTADGVKCIEVNAAGALGGWDMEFVGTMMANVALVDRFAKEQGITLIASDVLGSLMAGSLDRHRARHGLGDEHNMAVVAETAGGTVGWIQQLTGYVTGKYRDVLRREMPEVPGELLIDALDRVVIGDDGRVLVGDKPIHGLVEYYAFDRPERLDEVALAMTERGLQVFDGPASTFVSDKRLLALVLDQCERGLIEEDRARILRATLPWTRLVVEGPTEFNGEVCEMASLLAKEREQLVLKKGASVAGADVLMGKEAEAAAWEATSREALASGAWIVQQRLESRTYPVFTRDGVEDRTVVWGAYGVGDNDGELFGRASGASGASVINLSQGALRTVTFNVDD